VRKMMRRTSLALLLAVLCVPARASALEEQWWLEADIVEDSVVLEVTVRYAGCGRVAGINRVGEDGHPAAVWEAAEGVPLDTDDIFVDCMCEPIVGGFGTGQKSCPNQQCNKDQLCACSRACHPILDKCPLPGTYDYEVVDSDGVTKAVLEVVVSSLLPGCKLPEAEPRPKEEEPEEEQSDGGCAAAGAAGRSPAGFAVPALLLFLLIAVRRFRFYPLALLILAVAVCGCGKSEKDGGTAGGKGKEDVVLQPIDADFEGTPWEQVVDAQSRLLDFFETGSSPASVISKTKRWRKRNLEPFKKSCAAALAHYAQEPEKRTVYIARAGRVWSVVKKRVGTLSEEWGPAEKREVGMLLTDFECR